MKETRGLSQRGVPQGVARIPLVNWEELTYNLHGQTSEEKQVTGGVPGEDVNTRPRMNQSECRS